MKSGSDATMDNYKKISRSYKLLRSRKVTNKCKNYSFGNYVYDKMTKLNFKSKYFCHRSPHWKNPFKFVSSRFCVTQNSIESQISKSVSYLLEWTLGMFHRVLTRDNMLSSAISTKTTVYFLRLITWPR